MKIIKMISIVLIVFSIVSSAQESRYSVVLNTIEGNLTDSDLNRLALGRYDGYEIPMNAGEYVNFFVYSEDFKPKLVLISPDGTTNSITTVDKIFAVLQLKVPMTGDWIIYIVGNDSARGKYYFQYAFADENSMYIPDDAPFCDKLDFITAHSLADFRFFEYSRGKLKLTNLCDKGEAFLDQESAGFYNSVVYEGDDIHQAESALDTARYKIGGCLGADWETEQEDWKNSSSFRSKYFLFRENTDNKRFIMILLTDYLSKNTHAGQFTVEVLIGREE